ncbi:hypothetical protein K3495_g11645 [Podosphaera aphanis]|nr:hypothetical protein K3495_g11645 [Podosphaera aphanis]
MQKSAFDDRRFCLWTRVLSRMVKDNILIPALNPAESDDFRNAHYLFHRNYFRPPYFKSEKIYWPHVKEWYFEYMNNKNESALLNEAMNRLEIYLDGRDRREKIDKVKEDKVMGQHEAFQPHPKPYETHNVTRFPYADRSSFTPKNSFQENEVDGNADSSRRKLNQLRFSSPGFDSSHGSRAKPQSGPTPMELEENRSLPSKAETSTLEYIKCRGCLRCAHGLDYPDDLFEGRIIRDLKNDATQPKCDYIICLECKQIFDHLQIDSFKFHLESPEHTSKVISRLQFSGKIPSVTTSTQRRLKNLEKVAVEKDYAGAANYISKTPHFAPQHPSSTTSKAAQVSGEPEFDSYSVANEKLSNNNKSNKAHTPGLNSSPKLPTHVTDDELESEYLDKSDISSQVRFLCSQQRRLDGRLESVEAEMRTAQTLVKDLGCQVETGANRTQALVRSFIRHDDAIKLLQRDAVQGKAITDIMEGAIDAMNGNLKSEVVSERLERQQMELDGVRKELQNKAEDLSSWLKVVDRHTTEIMSLKQKIWINGQVNNPSDSSRFLVQKLEHQMQIQQEATRSFMLKTEQRFEALVRQYSEEINSLKRSDEDKQKQIKNLKAQASLKFAQLEQQKTAYLRRSKS